MNAEDLARITEMGRAWMRASLAERPADPEQQRRVRVLVSAPAVRAS